MAEKCKNTSSDKSVGPTLSPVIRPYLPLPFEFDYIGLGAFSTVIFRTRERCVPHGLVWEVDLFTSVNLGERRRGEGILRNHGGSWHICRPVCTSCVRGVL